MADAIRINPARTDVVKDKPVLLIDDVMTSGATLSSATQACLGAGAKSVDVLVLARAPLQAARTSD